MGDALAWPRIGATAGRGVETWFVAGSSPWEWEASQHRAPQAQLTFLVVSAYDLNENFLCDFHPNVVSLSATVRDLLQSRPGWPLCKRVLSQYPLMYTRIAFPTASRSGGVMEGLRDKAAQLLTRGHPTEPRARPTAPTGGTASVWSNDKAERISDWPKSRAQRRLAALRSACGGLHSFRGPKRQALLRMVRRGQQSGHVVVVVVPVSPLYQDEFMPPEVTALFNESLAEVQRSDPQVQWVRLDHLPALASNDYFWDLVHMNQQGQALATDAMLSGLKVPGVKP
jgi:hypothetical protein